MFNFYDFNVDSAIECVKLIYECNLCATCDKPQICCMRYPCGHSACENCVAASLGCYICLTPPEKYTFCKPTCDAVLTLQAKNACHLFDAFQQAFKIDVYKRKRISEQLKLEKELFPQCIQAPIKYYNKRKSYNTSFADKENYSPRLLQHRSPSKITTMENSINYVQNWLNKNDKNLKRKPLSDLNLDNGNIKRRIVVGNKKAESSLNKKDSKNKQGKSAKKPLKTHSIVETKDSFDTFLTRVKSKQNSNNSYLGNKDHSHHKNIKALDKTKETDESGICIDNDNSIFIEDDTQSIKNAFSRTVDKDRKALLAIVEADKNEKSLENIITQKNENIVTNQVNEQYNVPYYKMSYLKGTHDLFSTCIPAHKITKDQPKDLTKEINITIDSSTFTTTIQINKNVQRLEYLDKKSIAIQTNISGLDNINSEQVIDIDHLKNNISVTKSLGTQSPDLFTVVEEEGVFIHPRTENEKSANVIIDESDSSEDIEDLSVLEVAADIHTPNDQVEYNILNQVENMDKHKQRPRRKPRGHTPDSSNSSDKENFDPNRPKRSKNSKKCCYKK